MREIDNVMHERNWIRKLRYMDSSTIKITMEGLAIIWEASWYLYLDSWIHSTLYCLLKQVYVIWSSRQVLVRRV